MTSPARPRDRLADAMRRGATRLDALALGASDLARTGRFLAEAWRFRPRSDDIYVVSYPRSGTTWTQYLVHLLVHDGADDFEHIGDVAPWWERTLARGVLDADDLEALPSPRVFKSHLPYAWLPRRGRCLYIERDGRDVALSYFHLYRSHLGYRGDFETFFARYLRGELQYRSWFKHTAGWHAAAADNSRVKLLRYEAMRRAPRRTLLEVARFLEVRPAASLVRTILEKTHVDSMRVANERFDHLGEWMAERGMRRHAFVRDGKVGAGISELSESQRSGYARAAEASWRWPTFEWRLGLFLR